MFWVFAFEVPRICETGLKGHSFSGRLVVEWWFCESFGKILREGFWEWFFVYYVYILICYAVNGPWFTLDFIKIFMLVNQVGSVIGDLCVCVVVCLYELWDGILMFSHMMVVIGDRPSWLSALFGLSTSDQVSVLNHRILIYEIYIMYSSIEHVVACYRLHFWLSIWLLIAIVESMAIT